MEYKPEDADLAVVNLQNGFPVMGEVLHAEVGDREGPVAGLKVLLQGPILAALPSASFFKPVVQSGKGKKVSRSLHLHGEMRLCSLSNAAAHLHPQMRPWVQLMQGRRSEGTAGLSRCCSPDAGLLLAATALALSAQCVDAAHSLGLCCPPQTEGRLKLFPLKHLPAHLPSCHDNHQHILLPHHTPEVTICVF